MALTAAGSGKPPTGDKPLRKAHITAVDRHQLDQMNRSTWVKPRNTMVVPGIDVLAEVDRINQGHATQIGDSRYLINGRVYVVKPDGAAYPESGPGVLDISRPVMKLTRELIRHGGLTESFRKVTEREPVYTEQVHREALDLFNLWKRARDDVHS